VNAVSQRLFQSCHALCTLGSFKKEISEKRFNQVLKYSLKKQNLNVSINCTYINYYKVFSSVITIYHESTPQHLNLNYTPFITDLNLRELEKKKKKKSSSDCSFYCQSTYRTTKLHEHKHKHSQSG